MVCSSCCGPSFDKMVHELSGFLYYLIYGMYPLEVSQYGKLSSGRHSLALELDTFISAVQQTGSTCLLPLTPRVRNKLRVDVWQRSLTVAFDPLMRAMIKLSGVNSHIQRNSCN
jgi:hypothetical protein